MKKFIILLCFIPAIIFANEYTLDELINKGLNKVTSVITADFNQQNADADYDQAIIDFFPSASVSLSHRNSIEGNESNSLGLTISKSISLNEPSYFNYKRAVISRLNSGLDFKQAKKQAVYDIFYYYTNVIEAFKVLKIQQQNLEVQTKINRQTEILYASQRKTSLDLKQSKIDLLNSKISLKTTEDSYKTARRNLFNYLDLTDEGYEFIEPSFTNDYIVPGFQKNFSILMQENRLKSTKISLKQNYLNFLPTLSASISYNYSDSGNFDEALDIDDYSDNTSFSISASYDLLSFFNNSNSYGNAERNFRLAEINLEDKIRNSKTKYTELTEDLATKQQKFELIKQKLELANQSLELALKNHNLGRISRLDLDRARLDLLNSKLEYTRTRWELLRKQQEINLNVSNKILNKY